MSFILYSSHDSPCHVVSITVVSLTSRRSVVAMFTGSILSFRNTALPCNIGRRKRSTNKPLKRCPSHTRRTISGECTGRGTASTPRSPPSSMRREKPLSPLMHWNRSSAPKASSPANSARANASPTAPHSSEAQTRQRQSCANAKTARRGLELIDRELCTLLCLNYLAVFFWYESTLPSKVG